MFKIELTHDAQKDLKKLKRAGVLKGIEKSLKELRKNPFFGDVSHLQNFPHAQYRKRVGNYRILFSIHLTAKIIYIYRIEHRKQVYRYIII